MVGPLVLVAYAAVLSGLVLYSLHRGWLHITYRRAIRNSERNDEWLGPLPAVTVQLPVYNERHVVERLVDAVCSLEDEGHHPDFKISYRDVEVVLYTHVIDGLHENDFILASKISDLLGGSDQG